MHNISVSILLLCNAFIPLFYALVHCVISQLVKTSIAITIKKIQLNNITFYDNQIMAVLKNNLIESKLNVNPSLPV